MLYARRWVALLLICLLAGCASQQVGTTAMTAPRISVQEQYQQALDLMTVNRFAEAETILTKLARRHPSYTGPVTNLGIIAAKTQQYESAQRYFSKALSAKRDNMVALTWLAQVCKEQGQLQQAQMWLEKAVMIAPDHADAHLNLAILYDTELRRPDKALENYQRYLQLTGSDSLPVAAWARELQQKVQEQQQASRVAAAGAP